MATENKLYPNVYEYNDNVEIATAPHLELLNMKHELDLNKHRINEFLLKKKELENTLKHYKKIKYKWTNIDSGLKISGVIIGGLLGISAAALSGASILGLPILIYLGIGTGIASSFNLFLSETITIGMTSKKKKIYREICEITNHSINKLYLFQVKATEDKIITEDEIKEADKIIEEWKNEINKLKTGNVIEKVEKNAKKEIEEKLKLELKDIVLRLSEQEKLKKFMK